MIYDLIVIGGGPAGYLAAERAGHAGLSVALIEKRSLGGVCLNEGCIPSKALLNSAKLYEHAIHSEKYGVTVTGAKLDHAKVVERKAKVVKTLVGGVGMKMKANKVTVFMAEASIQGKTAEGFAVKAGDEVLTGARLLICSGSVPSLPPIPGSKEGLEAGYVMTNREILDMTTVPENLCIIGGGVIGLEMASYFNTAGSHVTVVEMLDHIAGPTDAEISALLLKEYQKKGIDFRLGAKVVGMEKGAVSYEKDGKTEKVPADVILMSIGRRANTAGLGLETLGVELNRGAIVTDERGQTNVAGVWAAGDVNGKSMLAHTAYREAEVAVNNILGKRDVMRYNAIPSVIYTNPEVACVGMSEEAAKAAGVDYVCKKLSMRYSGRFVAENEGGDGLCKILVDKKYNKVIGVHLIGNSSSEIIWGAAALIETELRVEDIRELVFPHPTVSEIIRETIFEF
ncbi:MAG: dihydrolipoyl dehydrogenase [Clostridiaceae bacterium]|nr:dihydrolipoyl dehydrogenase [Clostridiaceae bacterium]MDY3071366.1 dihydrolipoyl dehydrogenase [Eubacteriales bacterium]MDY3285297.1 dihydrolipoyl dehydrogenase [Eubacteriales bacterium]MDY5016064.1 dihydrolipoyl dehydrogenase [Eubacteriales bacterium]